MGLDMYLRAKRYTSNYNHVGAVENNLYKRLLAVVEVTPRDPDRGAPSAELSVTVAYWRKANAIHNWFVREVQKGEDKCREHDVSREQLQTLRDLCAKAIKTKDASLLEPKAGFFFGSTDIDDWYWEHLENTVKQLDYALKEFGENWTFAYQSSW